MTNEEKLALYKSLRSEYLKGKLCKIGLEAFPEEFKEHKEDLLEHLRDFHWNLTFMECVADEYDEEAWRFELKCYLDD